jgi:UTP--glucose-1-phosphate uridylyltransferase
MKTTKAVITAAARNQRTLPLQTLVDRDGCQKSVLCIIIEEALRAGIEDICLVICPGDEAGYRQAAGDYAERLQFVPQTVPLGYGHAVWCARDFVGKSSFLHMIGDHVYIAQDSGGCAQQLIEVAASQSCSVSGVQSTREGLLPYFGAIGGQRVAGAKDLYLVDRVLEKPTPTEAEQKLLIPGLRTGHYLCFFGMHVFTPAVMELLDDQMRLHGEEGNIQLSPVLADLAVKERYLALEAKGRRYPVDARYGLLTAQVALALSGRDRSEVLALLCELLAQREMDR